MMNYKNGKQTVIEFRKRKMKKLKLFLLPKDEADKKDAIIEIRAGTGGLKLICLADLFKKKSHKKMVSGINFFLKVKLVA